MEKSGSNQMLEMEAVSYLPYQNNLYVYPYKQTKDISSGYNNNTIVTVQVSWDRYCLPSIIYNNICLKPSFHFPWSFYQI